MGAQRTKISRPERERVEKRNRALLERELLAGQVAFESRPYEAHVQFSNFCNMSCVMCWDGENPPVERMSPEILAKVAEQVAPHLSLITPHGGSEPLALTWDETRTLCCETGVDLCLTTNVQFLDEERFHELRGITQTLALSIDSHIPEVFAKIRPNSRPDKVFANLATAARLARETQLDCVVQIVFLTQNGPTLPETVAYMGDIGIEKVSIIQMIDVNGRSGMYDPLLHFSAEYVDHLRKACINAAEEKRLYIRWLDREWHDFRADKIPTPPRERWNDEWDFRMKHTVPGYCKYAYDRLQISAAGIVTPCAYAADGELEMGSLAEQDFDEIWNGPTARDLRRSMMTWDYTSLCNTCRFSDKLPPGTDMRFVHRFAELAGRDPLGVRETLEVLAPEHMTRHDAPPSIRVATPAEEIDSYHLVSALGADPEQSELAQLPVSAATAQHVELPFPQELWNRMGTNLGYWWTVVAVTAGEQPTLLRPAETRCLIRHEPMERIPGSTLRYPDEGNLPVVDLGGAKQAGWRDGVLPARPRVREYQRKLPSQRDLSHHKKLAIQGQNPYPHMIARIRRIAASALPKAATVLVASKGDDALLELGDVEAWHFPRADDGTYQGFHPENSEAAIEALERLRSAGADHLLLPATSMWWLDYYDGLATHLHSHYRVAAEDTESCVIFALTGDAPQP